MSVPRVWRINRRGQVLRPLTRRWRSNGIFRFALLAWNPGKALFSTGGHDRLLPRSSLVRSHLPLVEGAVKSGLQHPLISVSLAIHPLVNESSAGPCTDRCTGPLHRSRREHSSMTVSKDLTVALGCSIPFDTGDKAVLRLSATMVIAPRRSASKRVMLACSRSR